MRGLFSAYRAIGIDFLSFKAYRFLLKQEIQIVQQVDQCIGAPVVKQVLLGANADNGIATYGCAFYNQLCFNVSRESDDRMTESDLILVRELMARELETVNHYASLLKGAKTSALRDFIAKVITEEKEHIAEAAAVLDISKSPTATTKSGSAESVHPVEYQPFFNRQLSVASNQTLLAAALDADIPIRHVCGGHGQCGTCRVEVVEGIQNLTPVTEAETRLLGDLLSQSWRLACQSSPKGRVVVKVPPIEE